MQHNFLQKEFVSFNNDEGAKAEGILSLTIDYTDFSVKELQQFSPISAPHDYLYGLISYMSKKIELTEKAEQKVYSDTFTEKACRELLSHHAETKIDLKPSTFVEESGHKINFEKQVKIILEMVEFYPYEECPEKLYRHRIESFFSQQTKSVLPLKDLPFPFDGTRRLYDEQLTWLNG